MKFYNKVVCLTSYVSQLKTYVQCVVEMPEKQKYLGKSSFLLTNMEELNSNKQTTTNAFRRLRT